MFKNVNNEEFRKNKYYKIVNSLCGLGGIHHYTLGLNEYNYEKLESIKFGDGLYFTNIENIFAYIDYGPILLELSIPENAKVSYEPEQLSIVSEEIPGWCANKIFVESMQILDGSTIMKLIDRGAKVSANNYQLFVWACKYNPEAFSKLISRYGKVNIVNRIYQYSGFDKFTPYMLNG